MASVTWLEKHVRSCEDAGGKIDSTSATRAWVFPDGVAAGLRVQHFSEICTTSGIRRDGVSKSVTQCLSIGDVTSVDGDNVTFSWVSTLEKHDESPWTEGTASDLQLTLVQECDHEAGGYAGGSIRQSIFRAPDDSYTIPVADSAWKMLELQPLVVTLASCQLLPEGNEISVEAVAINGDGFILSIAAGSTVDDLAQLVQANRGLDDCSRVIVIDRHGVVMKTDTVLHLD
eukprot:TRINITY_DN64140_c0_g1_i1.p1 TRINITY_DN64140_c0_g1~~TRINITY_DN64140_c0_g1_i1.p1  ORF type:complete len:230 (+),score=30.81 TRINITY_DN64140_c0_g1_i1:81-770(+)